MLQMQPRFDHARKLNRPETDDVSLLKGIDIVNLMAIARRHLKATAICVAVFLALALAYGITSDVKFTAQTSILIGNRQIRAIQDISAQTNMVSESALVDNQTEVIKSERVLLAVIRNLKLMEDPEFNGTEPPSLALAAYRFVLSLNPMRLFQKSSGESDPEYRMLRTVVGRVSDAIKITRSGKSNVLQVAVTVKAPGKAARMANGVAEAYLADQLLARAEAAKNAGDWFRTRVRELRDESAKANETVDAYRSRNNLLQANGQLFSDQQLSQSNVELAQAIADVGRKQAQYDNLQALIDSGRIDAFIPEANNNSTVTALRQQQADLKARYNEIVARVGPHHQLAVAQKRRVDDKDQQIFDELRRFLSGFHSDLAVAKERREQLAKQLVGSTAVTTSANASLVQLRQLEQEASAVQALYQSFLQRYNETLQQESFPINDARIISLASAPLGPSEPRMTLLAAGGILLGLGCGVGLGAYRELSDRAYRKAEQVESDLGVQVFGMLPMIGDGSKGKGGGLRDYSPPETTELSQYAIKHPFSSYAETLRAIKIGIDDILKQDAAKIVGIVSSMPREGKSTVSMNLASLLALQGSRVMVIDADLREAGLTRLAGLKPTIGLGEVLLEQASLGDVLTAEASTGLTILPATVKHNFFVSGELISSPTMAALLKSLSRVYDYIIVDLPPIGPVVDSRAAAQLLDAIVMVVEWGNVPRRFVRNTLAASAGVQEKMIGAVLNKVQIDKLKSYEPYGLDKKQEEVFNRYYR